MERVELHIHTKMSQMDGITSISDYINRAKEYGMTSLAITDHGVVQAFTEAHKLLGRDNPNMKIIYGMEGYYVPTNNIKARSYHISLLAINSIGLKNLYKLVSLSNLNCFYKKPLLLKNIIEEYREGLLLGSACEAGELYQAIELGKPDDEIEEIAKFYDYLEIQPIENNYDLIRYGLVKDKQALIDINLKIVALGKKLNKLVVATGDVHFLNKEDELYRRILQFGQGYKETDNQPPLYLRTTEEMLKEFDYLGKEKAYEVVVTNTNKIADMCEQISPISSEKCYPCMENSEEEIKELTYRGAYKIFGNTIPKEIEERLNKELNLIIENKYATLYMIAQKLVQKSNEDGYISSTRGTVGSSLVAYCIGITEINPIKYNIPFESFTGFYGNIQPYIYLNFAKEYQRIAQENIKDIIEGSTTYNAGVIGTITDELALKYVEQYYNEKNLEKDEQEIEKIAKGITGIKRTTGQTQGGIIVVPEGIEIPVQHFADDPNSDIITTHFDYHSLDLNLFRVNILANKTLTMLQKLKEITGIDPMTISLEDKETMELFTFANTLGIPEFETKYKRSILIDTQPITFDDLIKINGLANGTDVWIDNAQELIENETITLKETISCCEDIMNYLIEMGIDQEIAFNIMETVRKGNVARNKESKWEEYKSLMKEHNVPNWYIKSCEKIRYLFSKAHIINYVLNSFRVAWFKVHYPQDFYKVYFEVCTNIDIIALNGKEKIIGKLQELEEYSEKNETEQEQWNLPYVIADCELALEMFEKGINI